MVLSPLQKALHMTVLLILQGWKDYDNRKQKLDQDPRQFNVDEAWEVDFLVRKVQQAFPMIQETGIRNAIQRAGRSKERERQVFVDQVIELLPTA